MPRGPRTVAEQYLQDVLKGRETVSDLVGCQVERHFKDLREGAARGLRFNRQAAQHVIDFFPLFTIGTEDQWRGVPIELEPWWQGLLWILYGWRRRVEKRWVRRFKFGYIEVGRGNLKTLVGSGLCLYEFRGRRVQGARVYSAATSEKTARIAFNTARDMVLETWQDQPVVVSKDNLADLETGSSFEWLSSEGGSIIGLRPSFALLDELHLHPNSVVWDLIESALGKRIEALMLAITNSGFDRQSVCFRQREYAERVVRGIVPDDTWIAWICGIDATVVEKDPKALDDQSNWKKANPSLDRAVRRDELRDRLVKAKEDPTSLDAFLRFRLCVWTTRFSIWMPMDKWSACKRPIDPEKLRGRRCFGGMDLATINDIAAFLLLFEPVEDDPYWRLLPHFFLPRERIHWRSNRDRVPYKAWADQGLFHLTDGDIIDYRFIRRTIQEERDKYFFTQIGFDRWNSTDIVTRLGEDGFEMVRIGQGFQGMAYPTKRFMELALNGDLAHDGHEVLTWMVGNVIVQQDPAGNAKPDKSKSREKIDGAVASIIAVSLTMAAAAQSGGIEVW